MKRAMLLLLTLLLALPTAMGEGSDMPVDAFIARTGIEADAAMRARIGDFLREQSITAPILDMIDDARLARYARHIAEDIPISYGAMLKGPSEPLPGDAPILQLALTVPQGAAMESLLIDFERGLAYYDETFPVPEDVCRAQYAGPLSEAAGQALVGLIRSVPAEVPGESVGVELSAVRLSVAWAGGVTRLAVSASGASEAFMKSVWALLNAGRAAAQGEDL